MEYALLLLLMIPPVAFVTYSSQRSGENVLVDLGLVFVGIVFVYAWLPLLGLVLAQHGYGVLQDIRVVDDIPTSAEIVAVGASYLAFLGGFALFYRRRRKVIQSSAVFVRSDGILVLLSVVIAGLLIFTSFLVGDLLGIGGSESYIDSYAQLRQLPPVVQQITSSLAQTAFSASLAVMVFIISWKPSLHRYVAFVIFILLLWATFSGGSRTFGFLLAFAYVVCISIYVRGFKTRHLLWVAIVGVALFIFAGVFRADGGFNALLLTPFQGGEFVSLFINSVDLYRKSGDGSGFDVPQQIYWVDILRFIPQQILAIEKIDPAVWYVSNYYPDFYEMGGGLAFGAIAESVIGFGLAEAFMRGGLLGVAYAIVANRCTSGLVTPMKAFIYVWFVVMSYQAIRDTSFSAFPRFFFQALPVIIVVSVGYRVMRVVLKWNAVELPTGLKSGS